MKNFKLNLKGLYGYRQSLLSRSPQPRDNREMSERRPSEERTLLAPVPQRFVRYAAMLIMLLTLGVGQMWADTWTVAGDNAATLDTTWSPSTTGNDMIKVGDNWYLCKHATFASNGTIQFKACKDHDWSTAYGKYNSSDNASISYTSGTRDILFVTNATNSAWGVEITKWTLVGDGDLVGADWSPTTADNNMTYSAGIYTKTLSNVELECGTEYGWKVASNGNWDNCFPSDNKTYTPRASGIYNLTFTFNPSTFECTLTATPTSTTHYVFGQSPLSWDACGGTAMTVSTDYNGTTIYYLQVNGSRQFKVMDTYNDWTDYSTKERNKNNIDNNIMRTDIDLADANDDKQITMPSAGYIIYYPSTSKLCAASSLTNLGKPYDITYLDGGGGDFSGEHASGYPTTHSYGTATTLKSASKTGYTFGGWFTNSACTEGTSGTLGATAYDDDITLYAKWTPKTTTLTIKANGGAQADQTPTATYDSKTVTSFTKVTKAGSGLDGYYTSSSGGVMVINASGSPVASASDATYTYTDASGNWKYTGAALTLWAQWLSNVTVTYDGNDADSGSAPTDANSYIPDGEHKATVLGNSGSLAKAGYTWSGWNTAPDGGGTSYVKDDEIDPITSNVTLYAKWVENKTTLVPTVSYQGGATPATPYTATSSNTLGVATSTTLTASTPNADHYTFAGWTLTNLTVTDGNEETDKVIKVRITTPGSPIAAVAKYQEVLTTPWTITGGTGLTGSNWPTPIAMTKKSGHSTESVAYYTFSISATNNDPETDNYESYGFKVVVNSATWYGIADDGNSWWYTRAISEGVSKAQTLSSSGKNIQIRADIAGDYEIKVDYSSTPTVTITYPTSYQVNYEVGTVKGASDDPSAEDNESNAISDGDLVLSGTEVTFTAADAADGYTWAGWYDAATTAGTKLSVGTAQTYTTTISAATTVYAVYTENLYTVTVSAGDHGSISVPVGGTVSAGADTKPTITASPSTNYAFKWWSNTDGNVTATDWNSASTTVSATAAGTITANFFPQWALAGGDWNNTADDSDALGDWDTWTNGFEGFGTNASSEDTCIVSVTLPANTDFKFKIVDHRTGDWYGNSTYGIFKMTYADNNGKYWEGHVNSGSDKYQEFGLATAGAGSYKFAWNKTDKKAAVFFPTSYKVTFGYGTGGTSVSASVSGSGAGAIANNQYAASGSNITFSESHSNGYTFKGWYDAASGGSAVATMGKEDPILNSIAADASVYAQYTENMTTVTLANNGHGHVEIGGETVTSTTAGVTTTRSITAVPDAGYYFSGWTITEGTDFHLNGYAEANATATLTGNGDGETSGQTLTANFVELDKIYFRNIFDDGEGNVTRWESVYVHFDITWAEHDGKQAVQTSSDNISKGLHCSMTKIGTSDVYWAYVPRYITTNSKTSVAFADHDDSYNNSKLWEGNAAGRGDYNPLLNMFVPHHTKLYSTNSVDYYSNGYWMKYDTRASQGAGYYLKVYNSRNNYTEKGEFTANTDDATMIRFQVRVDNTNADKTRFMITSAGGLNYIADATVTSVSGAVEVSENLSTLTDNDVYFQLTATSEGYYTFILDQTGDEMKLSVDYPVAVGDYRLKHTYNDGSAHTTYSDIIKSEDAATGVIASMYLNTSNSPTFVLEKCTAVSPKIEWTQQGSDLWSAQSGNFNKGNGVYQFDIAITAGTTSTINSITEAKPYEGNYYIKTDCAPGGWTSYKSNVLDKNTINFDGTSNTFDYYMCRNTKVADKNVKFVIANDYNIAVTDTIDADATYLTGDNKENVPEACCVRFSYNSVTNDAKRAYLRYSSNNNFLNIIPSAASKVYDAASAGNDLYNSGNASSANKFGDDDGNFVYRKTIYAVSGATIDVKAEYTTSSKKQTFVTGHQPITSSSASTRYPIQVVYDFKTNNLTTAWHPGASAISDEISKVNYMYIRNGQAAADQLSFSGSGALTDAKVCGAFQFAYDDYVGKVGAWPQQAGQATGYTNEKCMFYFSFPFNVKVSDIFGIGTYGKEWKIQYYDGAERASKGFFRGDGTTTFWKDMPSDGELEAYRGYSLLLDNDYFNTTAEGMVFNGKSAGSSVYLYFPSNTTMKRVMSKDTTITIPSHECTLTNSWVDPSTKQTLYHSNTDSHWNMLGVPLLNSQENSDFTEYFVKDGLSYLYEWNPATNTLRPAATGSGEGALGNFTFKAMGAYMVQFAGDITFTGAVAAPSSVAARQKKETKNYTIDLEVLDGDDERINHTYVELRDGASDDFMLNEDMYMTLNSNAVNIYSFAGDYDVAANVLSLGNHVVPVGVAVKKAGTYKFSMPYEFSGTVTLVDKFNNTRTNLAFDEYEVYLEKGSINDRFDMEINIRKVPTSIENIDGSNALNDGGVHKFIENDQMYILKNGAIYNAQGVKVK